MRVIRVVLTALLSTVLAVLVLALSLSFTVKSFVQNEVAKESIKELLRVEYSKTNKLTAHKQEVLDRVFYDKKTNATVDIIIRNFLKFREDKSKYVVPEKDLKPVREFLVAHRDDLAEFAEEEIEEQDIIDHFQVGVINDEVIDIFTKVNNDLNKPAEVILEVYSKTISSTTRALIIAGIAVCGVAIAFLNLPITKIFSKLGLPVLVSGIVLIIIYIALLVFKDMIINSFNIGIDISKINFNMFLGWGIGESALGAAQIIVGKLLTKKALIK